MTMAAPDNRIMELLAAFALGDLSTDERTELDTAIASRPELAQEAEAFELAAAAATLGVIGDVDPMDADLRDRLLSQSASVAAAPVTPRRAASALAPPAEAPLRFPMSAVVGWLAAAACLLIAALAWLPAAGPASLVDERASLLASADDAVVLPWGDWELAGEGPEIAGVTGDVVWSESAQTGYLRFVGLPANDPSVQQYQLWIIDERGLADANGQSARVSGAIFDATTGEVIVPIDPSIPIRDAAAFAITIEEPGGVWASDMSRRVTIAARG